MGADSLSEALMTWSLTAAFEKPVCPTQGCVCSRTDSSIGTHMLAGEARKQMCLWCASDAIQAVFKQPDEAAVFSEATDPSFASAGSQTCGLFMLKDRQHNSSIKVHQTDTLTPVIPSCGACDAT